MVQYVARTCSAFSVRLFQYTGQIRDQWQEERKETIVTVDKCIGVNQTAIKSETSLMTHI